MLKEVVRLLWLSLVIRSHTLSLVLMADPNWKNGFYYDALPPHTGMKLARRTFNSVPSYHGTQLSTEQRLLPSPIDLVPNGINVSDGKSDLAQNLRILRLRVFLRFAPTFSSRHTSTTRSAYVFGL